MTQSSEGTGHKIIYCVHGKPDGCCARVLSESNSLNGTTLPSQPITLCKLELFFFIIFFLSNYFMCVSDRWTRKNRFDKKA